MLQRKTPLKRSAFKRKLPSPRKIATPRRKTGRGAAYTATADAAKMVAKPRAHRNRRLLDLARGMPCLFRVPGVCCGDPDTTVAAHSNLSIHGKAGARKANDEFSAWSCVACHTWYDQGSAAYEVKLAAFMTAHARQVAEWEWIAQDIGRAPEDRAAARWALELLKAESR
jgi:hypothetical protein